MDDAGWSPPPNHCFILSLAMLWRSLSASWMHLTIYRRTSPCSRGFVAFLPVPSARPQPPSLPSLALPLGGCGAVPAVALN